MTSPGRRISRPSLYRYFSDREELLLTVTAERSLALVKKAHRFLARQPSFADAIVNGLLYLADHGRRDVITRHLIEPDDSAFSDGAASTHTYERLTSEFWSDYLALAQASGGMNPELDLDDVHLWLGTVGLMLMSWMERAPDDEARHRRVIESLVLPGLLRRTEAVTRPYRLRLAESGQSDAAETGQPASFLPGRAFKSL